MSAELRLWDAIEQHRLVPFSDSGVTDSLDLRDIPWVRGRGYDTTALTGVITSTDISARQVLRQCADCLGPLNRVRALDFCLSVEHAHFMARVFERPRGRAHRRPFYRSNLDPLTAQPRGVTPATWGISGDH
jgi:hypothetical protein